MSYLLLFLEGILTFISPCLLPMLPIYVGYFIGQVEEDEGEAPTSRDILLQAILFVLGFSLVFITMSLFVSTLGRLFVMYRQWIYIIVGIWMIILGLDYIFHSRIMNAITQRFSHSRSQTHSGSSFVLGLMFAISWTPCVGTFLASALAYAATADHLLQSVMMLVAYCLGLGLPFILTALLLDEFQATFTWIKQHFRALQVIGGILLIVMGLSIMTGWMDQLLALLS